MARMDRIRGLLSVSALLLGVAGAEAAPVGTTEHTQFVSIWTPDPDAPRGTRPAGLLNVPPGWTAGDAAVLLAPGGAWPDGMRDRLVAALLEGGAAVLEVAPLSAGAPIVAVAAELAGGLRLLREVEGAGLVVVIGFAEGGEAALAAGGSLPAGVEGFAAAVKLGPGAPVFASGPVPEAEAWSVRAPLFCDLLAGLQPAAAGFADHCQVGLLQRR